MARLYIDGIKADVLAIGGGASSPTFSETTIATGSYTGALVFTGDYMDYDLLKFICVNNSTGNVTQIITTPSLIEANRTITASIVLNEYANNQYVGYRIGNSSSANWTYDASRNLYVSEVRGLTCTNGTITETEIYNRGTYATSDVAITGKTGLLDYDMIFISAAYDGVQPNVVNIVKPFGETSSDTRSAIITPYNNAWGIRISDTQMSASKYFYVCGIKFS